MGWEQKTRSAQSYLDVLCATHSVELRLKKSCQALVAIDLYASAAQEFVPESLFAGTKDC